MKIYFDTNAVYQDYLLESVAMKVFERYLSWTNDELCVPKVVFEETIRHFQRKYQETLAHYDGEKRVFQSLGLPTNEFPDTTKAVDIYRNKLVQRLKELKARIVEIPDISLDDVLVRDLEEHRPFKQVREESAGFRDVIIWESILRDCR